MNTKKNTVPALLFVVTILVTGSCKKGYEPQLPPVTRQIQFELFTSHDFSKENDSISFTVFIAHQGNQPVWDSALAPMTLKDIPHLPQKWVVQKTLTGDTAVLKAGFRYEIKNVGHAGISDTLSAATHFKIISFDFN